MKSPRRRARELAVQAIYQAGINKTAAPEIAKNIHELSQSSNMDEELFNKLFFGAQTHAEEYMEKISPLLDRDEKDLSPIERAVLLVACHELSTITIVRSISRTPTRRTIPQSPRTRRIRTC